MGNFVFNIAKMQLMSYIRMGEQDSDVYIFQGEDKNGKPLEICSGCEYWTYSREQMLIHIIQHRVRGDCVPDEAFARFMIGLI